MSSLTIIDTMKSADTIIRSLLDVKKNERVLIVADTETELEMVNALAAATRAIGAHFVISIMPSREIGKGAHTTLPKIIQKSLEASDVVIGLTRTSLGPSVDPIMVGLLRDKRIRYMSMILRSMDNWTKGAATANYKEVYKTAEKLALALQGKTIEITTPVGTKINAIIEGRRNIIEAGFARKPGESAAFSDGEVSLGPVEGTAEGTIVIDGPMGYLGLPTEPVTLNVKKGNVVQADGGGREGVRLRKLLETVENLSNIAEIGIGVNPLARRTGDFMEEKKGLGNVHIALGDNIYYYGIVKCDLHIDLVMYNPTVAVDEQVILKKGVLQL